MGGAGSGKKKLEFDDKTIENIKLWRVIGFSWHCIGEQLGMRSDACLEGFRKENPEFEKEIHALRLIRLKALEKKAEALWARSARGQ